MNKLLKSFCAFAVAGLLVSCGGGQKKNSAAGDTIRFAYAQNITAVRHNGYTEVSLANPWKRGAELHRYILVARKDSGCVASLPKGTVVYTPVRRAVAFSAPLCQLLVWLGAGESLKGVCDLGYVHSAYVKLMAANGNIADCGNGMAPTVEKIVSLRPQALFVSPFENANYGQLEQLGVPLIECADYMETSALGRAEWMRFYGMLVGKERQADSLFAEVTRRYGSLVSLASKSAVRRSVITERKVGGVWYCPGGRSSMGRLIADAKGRYVFADDTNSGSLTLAPEAVIAKAAAADVWLFVYSGSAPMTRAALADEYDGYKVLKAFKQNCIYECGSDASAYFDEISFRPDFLLHDLVKILHPDINVPGGLKYYLPCKE